jgi:AAA family ATP:ADP antiporter
MSRFVARVLNLQRDELGRGLLLFSYLFLIITAYLIGKTARDTLFLSKFKPEQLPYVDIAIAALVGFVVAGYVRIGRHVSLRNLLLGSTAFFAVVMLLLWWLQAHVRQGWLYPAFYIWVGILGVLAPAQVWTAANYLLTTREAKRLYGFIGAGAVLGNISAGALTKAISRSKGPEGLLLAMALVLVASVFIIIPLRPRAAAIGQAAPGQKQPAGGATRLRLSEGLRLIGSSPYLRSVAALIWVSSFVTALAGWQFKTISQYSYLNAAGQLDTKAYAAFRGNFDIYTGILCLAVQLLLTANLLKTFGIGPALLVVPIAVVMGSQAVLAWGSLAAVVFLAGSDKILRYSIDRSTAELLYLPVPAKVKIPVKSFVDTVVWRLGDGLQGVAVLLFVWLLSEKAATPWIARSLSYVTMFMAMGWAAVAFLARRHYVGTLQESVRQHRLDAELASAPVLDRATTEIFATHLTHADPGQLLYALSLFEIGHQGATHPAVRVLLRHPSAEIRRKALAISAAAGDKTVMPQVEALLRDPHVEVRTEALLYLARHAGTDPLTRLAELGDFPDASMRAGVAWYLAQPGPAQSIETASLILEEMAKQPGAEAQRARLEATRLIGELGAPFDDTLGRLLEDSDAEVAREAIRAAGKVGHRRLVPQLLNRLSDPQLSKEAGEALAKFGDPIAGTLRDFLADPAAPLAARREAPALLARMGSKAAAQALADSLIETDADLRFRVISALNKLRAANVDLAMDREVVESLLIGEIMGHYRSYQLLDALGEGAGSAPACACLRDSMKQELERIFRLLGLLFPKHDFHSAWVGLQSSDAVLHDNALELLDNILNPQLRNLLVPVLDGKVSDGERVRRAERVAGPKLGNREEAVAAMLASDDPALKSCGLCAVTAADGKRLEPQIDHCLTDPDPQVREAARQAKLRLGDSARATHD